MPLSLLFHFSFGRYAPFPSAKISAVPNVGNTCYMLQTLYMMFLIGGWTCEVGKVCEISDLGLRLLRSMEHECKDEPCPADLVRALAAKLYPHKPTGQQDVHETFVLISDLLPGTKLHVFPRLTWCTCPCGASSSRIADPVSMIEVSTDKNAVNLEDLINASLGSNDDGWNCRTGCGYNKEQATFLSIIGGVGKFFVVCVKRPFDRPRTDVLVPLKMSVATYNQGEYVATMVEVYLHYVVMHSTQGGNVPDEGNPDSVSNAQGGHYFGCEAKPPSSNSSRTQGCIVDCLADADAPHEPCELEEWVLARGKKVSMVMYSTEKPGTTVVLSRYCVCVCVCVGGFV